MSFQLNYQVFGEQAILISWPQRISDAISTDIHQFNHKIQSMLPVVVETVPAYCSLTVFIDNWQNKNSLIEQLKIIYTSHVVDVKTVAKKWEIPVCYDPSLGIDLQYLAQQKNRSVDEIIELHSQAIYTVDFIGFLPGFPYLSGLNHKLFTPRLNKPRAKVSRGAIAIGGKQTGIYPVASPGGWHIIGRTAVCLFNPEKKQPCLLKPLDKIKFVPVSIKAFKDSIND